MDCYIYAVEKSLDSYKFNLLQNKQVFINQLKSCNLAARTIDEGAIDENGGGNFSEYVAILSGNDDLLEKAKLDKKLAVLESERQAYHRNKGNAKGKLNEKTAGIEKNNIFIGRFTRDWEYLNKVAPVDTGNRASSQSPETGRCGLGQYRDTRQPACRNQSEGPNGRRLYENRNSVRFSYPCPYRKDL